MKIKELSLTNFRRFEQLDLKLPDSNFIILIGENGCGKSSVLDAMGVGLRTIVERVSKEDRLGIYQAGSDIHVGEHLSTIKLKLDWEDNIIEITNGRKLQDNYISSEGLKKIIGDKAELTPSKLPILVYYRLNRTHLYEETTPKEEINLSTERLIGYKHAFDKKVSSFQEFEEWFIIQENIESKQKVATEKNDNFELNSLKVIRKVVEYFLEEMDAKTFTNLHENKGYDPNFPIFQGKLTIEKNGKKISVVKQLSSGEKMILLLVCDIARRLLILNSMDENCLEGEGVVLIDEIEMHLHPKWQRRIVPALRKVFPNIQFIATTHSPQVLSNLSDNEIIVLDDNQYYSPATNPYGRDSNGILEEIFGTPERPFEADKLVDEIFDILSNGQHDMEKAETKLTELRGHLGAQDPILLRIENLINRKKILNP